MVFRFSLIIVFGFCICVIANGAHSFITHPEADDAAAPLLREVKGSSVDIANTIGAIHLIGEATENQFIRARVAINRSLLHNFRGQTRLTWLRDGEVIAGADTSRYRLEAEDIGARISMMVSIISPEGVVLTTRISRATQPVTMQAELEPSFVDLATTEQPEAEQPEAELPEAEQPEVEQPEAEQLVAEQREVEKPAAEQPEVEQLVAEQREVEKPAAEQPEVEQLVAEQPAAEQPEAEQPEDEQPRAVVVAEGLTMLEGARLRAIDFTASTILPQESLNAIEAEYSGKPITIDMIRDIVDATNRLYAEAGYELSRALLPEQMITDGVLALQLVDAKIGTITVENRNRVAENYILGSLDIAAGEPIDLARLENTIRQYNANNTSKISSELAPGQNFGETDIFVAVEEPDFINLPRISINNHGNELSDWRQNSFTTVFHNILGYDDEFSVSYQKARGSETRALGFSFPLGTSGLNITLNRSDTKTDISTGPDQTVGFRGESYSTSIGGTFPLVFTDQYSLYLSLLYADSYGELTQPGNGNLLAETSIDKYAVSLPMSWSNSLTTVSFSPTYSRIKAKTVVPRDEHDLSKIEADFSVAQYIEPWLTGNLRGKWLHTDDREFVNFPSEILSVGGPANVRAYQPGEDSGYRGYFLSAELRSEVAEWGFFALPEAIPSIQPYIFIDHAFAQSQFNISSRADYWSGAGIGITIPLLFDIFTFDAYWAEPLDGAVHALEAAAYDDDLIQFSLSARIDLY